MIIGCDFHPSCQMISWLDTETGETGEWKLVQATEEARQFYHESMVGGTAKGKNRIFPVKGILVRDGSSVFVGNFSGEYSDACASPGIVPS